MDRDKFVEERKAVELERLEKLLFVAYWKAVGVGD